MKKLDPVPDLNQEEVKMPWQKEVAKDWYEDYQKEKEENEKLRKELVELKKEIEKLKEKLKKLNQRTSENSSQPPSSDGYKKKVAKTFGQKGKKRGPKYDHVGKTRNGFGRVDEIVDLRMEKCPKCGASVEKQKETIIKKNQIAELVSKPVEVREYVREKYQCSKCDWEGYAPLPLGCREDFSYGATLSSLVGWLGYGGNLTWLKQRYLVETVFGIPLSQGSLAKMHRWFCESLYPSYEQWWTYIQEPGVRCVDETSYRVNGVNYWMWVATSSSVCVLFLAPSRSSDEVHSLLGKDFHGLLSTDCWGAYHRQNAQHKQKCLAHIGRELKALETSHFSENKLFAQRVFPILEQARQSHRDYHQGELSLEALQQQRPLVEAQLQEVLDNPPPTGWASDSQLLSNRFRRYWHDWFTFLTFPEVKPDNNDAERALRPVVIHRKVSGGARSHWGGQLVAMMFSFLETMRLQGKSAVEQLSLILSSSGLSSPSIDDLLPL